MRRARLLILIAMLSTGTARAAVSIVPLSVGPPTNSPQIMRNFGAAIIRLTSTSGNILSVSFSGTNSSGQPLGIFGRLAQRWTSSAGNGVYDTTSPGLLTEANFFPSPSNFDSHFLDTGIAYSITTPLAEGNVFFPDANPIPSDNNQGFGLGGKLVSSGGTPGQEGYLTGSFDVPAAGQGVSMDVAYIVLGGAVRVRTSVVTVGGTFETSALIFVPDVPEPAPFFLLCTVGSIPLLRRRNIPRAPKTLRSHRSSNVPLMEVLELRRMLSAPVPTGLAVQMGAAATAHATWADVSGEDGYRLEYSENGAPDWHVATETDANEAEAFHSTDAGQKYYYRVRSLKTGEDPSDPSNVASPITSVDWIVRVTASWSPSPEGLRLDWEPVQTLPTQPTIGFNVYRKERSSATFPEEPLNESTLSAGSTSFVSPERGTFLLMEPAHHGDVAKGKYMTWQIKGHVKVKLTKLRGPDAVLSGVFVN
ncbi:MAG: hypothetical protein ACREJC_22760 [Tepidisphaeraceae bacterium]